MTKDKSKSEYRNVSTLYNWKDNPRSIKDNKFEELKKRIKDEGQIKPLIITDEGEVLGGNMRLKAFQDLGIEKAWVSVVKPKNEAHKIKIALLDNEEMGYYQGQELVDLIIDYKDDIDIAKYSIHLSEPTSLDELLTEYSKDEIVEDEAPEPPTDPISKYGEVYQLGRHRLMCGDATKIEDVEKLMDGNKADMVFTSPPYNAGDVEKLSGNTHTTDNKYQDGYDDNVDQEDWKQLILMSLATIQMFSKYQFYNIQQLAGNKKAFIELLYEMRNNVADIAIWNKKNTAPAMAENTMNSQFEYVVIFSSDSNPSRSIKTADFRGTVSNVYDGQGQHSNEFSEIHSATFPIHLPHHFIKTFTKPNSLIVDNFAGTGTSMIVCEQTDRTCYMMELDPKYCDVIRKRYENFINAKNE